MDELKKQITELIEKSQALLDKQPALKQELDDREADRTTAESEVEAARIAKINTGGGGGSGPHSAVQNGTTTHFQARKALLHSIAAGEAESVDWIDKVLEAVQAAHSSSAAAAIASQGQPLSTQEEEEKIIRQSAIVAGVTAIAGANPPDPPAGPPQPAPALPDDEDMEDAPTSGEDGKGSTKAPKSKKPRVKKPKGGLVRRSSDTAKLGAAPPGK